MVENTEKKKSAGPPVASDQIQHPAEQVGHSVDQIQQMVGQAQHPASYRNTRMLIPLTLLPICVMLAATAVVLQSANELRMRSVPDDAILPSLHGFVAPEVIVCLILGYLVAFAAPVIATVLLRRHLQRDPACRE